VGKRWCEEEERRRCAEKRRRCELSLELICLFGSLYSQ
jgi:hypothetical protein